jgi:hypothetical protein
VVEDRFAGAAGKRIDLHWHLDPGWRMERDGPVLRFQHRTGARAEMGMTGVDEVSVHRGERDPFLGWHARGFGRARPTWTVRGTIHANHERTVRTVIEPDPSR